MWHIINYNYKFTAPDKAKLIDWSVSSIFNIARTLSTTLDLRLLIRKQSFLKDQKYFLGGVCVNEGE